MAELTDEQMNQAILSSSTIERKTIGNMVAFRGPFLKDKWYDSYTECLFANITEKNNQEKKRLGLNEYWQTPKEAADFKKRLEESKKLKERAALAAEMTEQNK